MAKRKLNNRQFDKKGWTHTVWSIFTAIGFISGLVLIFSLKAPNTTAAYIATLGLIFASVQFWRYSRPE